MVPPQPLGGAADKHNHKRKNMDDFDLILQNGINFGRGGERPKDDGKVKTKAKVKVERKVIKKSETKVATRVKTKMNPMVQIFQMADSSHQSLMVACRVVSMSD